MLSNDFWSFDSIVSSLALRLLQFYFFLEGKMFEFLVNRLQLNYSFLETIYVLLLVIELLIILLNRSIDIQSEVLF